jgi:hypothetical protein
MLREIGRLPGIPADFWVMHEDVIGKLIKAKNLKQLSAASHSSIMAPTIATAELKGIKLPPGGLAGILQVPHVHYKGEVYLLGEKEWAEFSGSILDGMRAKLSNVKNVSFNQLMGLADAMNNVTAAKK